jgi:hypothetical protein
MRLNVGDVVRIRKDDLLRGGQTARIQQVLSPRHEGGSVREYVVEFQDPPLRFRNSDRFLFCIYREEQLSPADTADAIRSLMDERTGS